MRGFWSLDASANHLIVATRTHRRTASVQVSVCQCVCVCLFVSDSVELCFGVQCVCVDVYVFECVCASISVPLAPVCVRQIVASLTFASHSMAAPLRLRQFCQTRFRDILLLLVSMVFFDRNINSEKTSNVCTFRWLPYSKNNITISYSVPHVTLVGERQEIEGHVVDLVTRLLLCFLRLWAESRKAMWRLDLLLVLRFDQRLLLSCHDIGFILRGFAKKKTFFQATMFNTYQH